jgi:hypothetical protein
MVLFAALKAPGGESRFLAEAITPFGAVAACLLSTPLTRAQYQKTTPAPTGIVHLTAESEAAPMFRPIGWRKDPETV